MKPNKVLLKHKFGEGGKVFSRVTFVVSSNIKEPNTFTFWTLPLHFVFLILPRRRNVVYICVVCEEWKVKNLTYIIQQYMWMFVHIMAIWFLNCCDLIVFFLKSNCCVASFYYILRVFHHCHLSHISIDDSRHNSFWHIKPCGSV